MAAAAAANRRRSDHTTIAPLPQTLSSQAGVVRWRYDIGESLLNTQVRRWWSGGVVEWWSGGVVEWWSGGVVEWWSGGVVEKG
jgi:hypothetical protein